MQVWLLQEKRDIEKARELRLKEATALVEAYAKGEITAQEADDRLSKYEKRWGDILHGAAA
jgi:hypothetical protein